jgi:hypothetical protein
MDQIITFAEGISLSEQDLINICSPNNVQVITYSQLININDINELFSTSDNIIILYRTTKRYGHWVSLLNYDTHIEYFDSYGTKPDYELELSYETLRHTKGETVPHLTSLLNDAQNIYKKKIIYNNIQLQEFHKDVNTCGRYASLRIKLRHIDLRKFQKLLTGQKYKPDMVVTYLTYLIVDKDIKDLIY